MDAKILEMIREDPRYTYEAYDFVCEAVTYTQDRLGRMPTGPDDRDDEHHVSGAELLRGACELAVAQFGMMAPVVFRTWGIHTTDDFGRLVFKLIQADKLSKSDRDDPEDFHDVFDLEKALTEGFELTLGESPRRGDR